MDYKYAVNKYAGRVYCGNAFCNTIEECIAFANDGFCDKAIIYDNDESVQLSSLMQNKEGKK